MEGGRGGEEEGGGWEQGRKGASEGESAGRAGDGEGCWSRGSSVRSPFDSDRDDSDMGRVCVCGCG